MAPENSDDKKVEAGSKVDAALHADAHAALGLLWWGPDGVSAPSANGAHANGAHANGGGGPADFDFTALAADDEKRVRTGEELRRGLGVEGGEVSGPVVIRHAIIEVGEGKTLDLSQLTFKRGVAITDSVFKGEVDFSFCTFERGVDLTGTTFERGASFRGARVEDDFLMPLASFGARACFDDLCVHQLLSAEGADFRGASFDRMEVRKSALFCCALLDDGRAVRTRFRGEATFDDARLSGPAYFSGAHFQGKVYFDRARVDSSAFFNCDLLSTRPDPSQPRHVARPAPRREVEAERRHFIRAEFEDTASFIGAHVNGSASFSGARFGREGAEPAAPADESAPRADFRRVRIEGTALFDPFVHKERGVFEPVRFFYDANFWNAGIKGAADFKAAYFGGEANFEHVRVGRRAYFCAAGPHEKPVPVHFRGAANFADAHIEGTATFEGAHFEGKADFERLTTNGSLYFRGYVPEVDPPAVGADGKKVFVPVRFARSARFLGCQTRSNAEFGGAQFIAAPPPGGAAPEKEDEGDEANFTRMVVGGSLLLRPRRGTDEALRFGKKAVFTAVEVKGRAEFSGTYFGAGADFAGMRVGGYAYFGRRFHEKEGGDKGARVAFKARRPRPARKGGARRKEIGPATFQGPAEFNGATFNNQVSFEGVVFEDRADFTGVGGVGEVNFKGATFKAEAVFREARFSSLTFDREQRVRRIGRGDREGRGGRECRCCDKKSWSKSLYRYLHSLASWRAFEEYVERPRFRPECQFQGHVDLRGCTYQRIEVKLEPLMERLLPEPVFGEETDHAKDYDRQPYTQLSRALHAAGDDRRAEFVYVRQRLRELRGTWGRLRTDVRCRLPMRAVRDATNLLVDCFLWAVARYGVQPQRLLVISLAVIALGAYLFSFKGAVQYSEPDSENPPTATIEAAPDGRPWRLSVDRRDGGPGPLPWDDSLKFSVSQFLPVVDIPSGSRWKASQDRNYWVWFVSPEVHVPYDVYASAHRLLGAILVPLLLAAVAASLYRRLKTEM